MNRYLSLGASLAVASIFLSACTDRDAENRRAAARQFDQLLIQVQQAQSGATLSKGKDADLAAAMKASGQALEAAGKDIEALTPQLAPAQQIEARRVRAVVVAPAQVDLDRFQALQAWGDVISDLPRLAVRLDALTQARAGARLLETDDTQARARIKDDLADAEKELQVAQTADAVIAKEVADLQSQVQAQAATRQDAAAEAVRLRAEALQKSGAAQADLNLKAIDADFRAQKADAEVARLTAVAAVAAARLKIADLAVAKPKDQIEIANRQLTQLEEQAKSDAALRQTILGSGASPASGSVSAQAAAFLQAFDRVDSRFKQEVEAPFDAAAEALSSAGDTAPSAANLLRQAIAHAGADNKRTLQFELLQAQTAYIDVIAQQQTIVSTYGRALEDFAKRAEAVAPESAAHVKTALARVQVKQARLKVVAQDAAAQALSLADDLAKDKALAQSAAGFKALIQKLQGPVTATP